MTRFCTSFLMFSGLILLMAACAGNAFHQTNRLYRKQSREFANSIRRTPLTDSAGLDWSADWVGTTNFGTRKPNFVIIHHTAQNSCDQTLHTFTIPSTQVSAHYIICREGQVFHMLNDLLRAHHAGVARWGNTTDVNSSSIGIEVDNNGSEPFTEAQIRSLITLLGRLKRTYKIPVANFIGHSDIAPGRKVDPSALFPWKQLADSGYGLWYDTTAVEVPQDFGPLQAMRIIGYDVSRPDVSVKAFKLHFIPGDTTSILGEPEKKILYSLQQRSQ